MKITDEGFDTYAYYSDCSRENVRSAREWQELVLDWIHLQGATGCTCFDIYTKMEIIDRAGARRTIPDIDLYLCLHWLIEEGKITGNDPYSLERSMSMDDWHYRAVMEDAHPE